MPRRIQNAKRASRPNPRMDRNLPDTHPHFERKYHRDSIIEDRYKRVEMLPKNLAQENYIDALTDDDCTIVLGAGCAGTGKTYLGTLYAIKGLQEGKYKKIIITRPAVSVDEAHGFLPGDLTAKLEPWARPILDVLKEFYSVPTVTKMIENEVIELAALAYMRGRNLKNSIILFDEAQNALPSQMKMVMTRIAEGSKLIITGDLEQHDRGFESNGFKDFIDRLEKNGSRSIALCKFEQRDVERHPIIEDVLRLYDLD